MKRFHLFLSSVWPSGGLINFTHGYGLCVLVSNSGKIFDRCILHVWRTLVPTYR